MSQFILLKLEKNNIINKFTNIVSIFDIKSNSIFLQNCADAFFQGINKNEIFTISNFDDLCVIAQRELINSNNIKKTVLWDMLYELKNIEFFCWYGNDLEELKIVNNFDDLILTVENDLSYSSGEIYLHYKSEIGKNIR